MIDEGIVKDLHERLSTGDTQAQAAAAEHIRDLCVEQEQYRSAFGSVVPPLVGLLDTSAAPASQALTHTAAQALGYLAENDAIRDQIRDVGGVENIVSVLKALSKASVSTPLGRDLRATLLTVLLALAVDEENRVAAYKAGLVPLLVHMLGLKDDPVAVERAAKLVGRLSYNRTVKDSVRDAHGVAALLKLLSPERGGRLEARLAETVVVALTVLAVNNELNQDAIRDEYGVAPIVKLLEGQQAAAVVSAAVDAVRAMALNNDANKTALREAWVLPQLVKLLSPEADDSLVGKAVDCLRILTTGNEANKAALFSIPSSLPALVRLMAPDKPLVVVERAAAVVGNLSSREQWFPAMREAGAIQRLVELLERGPQSRVTEIAAKTLANLAADDSNQTAIRLAGGIPPLMRLLTERPSEQVLGAVEEALRRLQVSGAERNAILDTLRYVDALLERSERARKASAAAECATRDAAAAWDAAPAAEAADSKPFTRYSVEETAELLRCIGFRETQCLEANGIDGGDLLELTDQELREELGLSHLQAKKIRGLQAAFKMFNSMMRRPGRGDVTFLELQEWLVRHGRSEADAASIRDGYMEALGKSTLAVLSFRDFARTFGWFASTLRMMAAAGGGGGGGAGDGMLRLSSSLMSQASLASDSPAMKDRGAESNGEASAAKDD